MIFVTVGTQAPFDRLVELVDQWALNKSVHCFAQIHEGNYLPKNMSYTGFMTEQEFNQVFKAASVVISHAGMGTIISCLREGKVLLTLPRLAKYKEQRNDHQLATTRAFAGKKFIYPIYSDEDLVTYLNKIDQLKCLQRISTTADPVLLDFLKNI